MKRQHFFFMGGDGWKYGLPHRGPWRWDPVNRRFEDVRHEHPAWNRSNPATGGGSEQVPHGEEGRVALPPCFSIPEFPAGEQGSGW